MKNKLSQGVWKSDIYYKLAKKGSKNIEHPGMKLLFEISKKAKSILDLGCGEGTRLNYLIAGNRHGTGVDISIKAICTGKKNYPKIKFIRSDLEKISLSDESFDLVFSAYVLEHLDSPVQVIHEALRLMKKGGYLVLIAPNYGAPNRASPPFKGNRINKFTNGLINDFLNLFLNRPLSWERVTPISINSNYHSDWDTVTEPYLGSLISHFKYLGFKVEYYNSCWPQELPMAGIHQRLFRLLGDLGFYPFNLWGPHLVLLIRK